MRKIFGILALVLALAVVPTSPLQAQDYQEIRALGLFPMGNYGRVGPTADMVADGLIGSGAAIGGGLGYRYSFDLSMGITFLVGGDILWNMTNPTYRQQCADNNAEAAPHYFNMPLSVGVALSTPLGDSPWSFFFDVTAGLNIHYTTTTGWKNFEVTYNPALSAAISAELGMRWRNWALAVSMLSLGSPEITIFSGEETFSRFPVGGKNRNMLTGNVVLSYKITKHKKEWKPSRKSMLDL